MSTTDTCVTILPYFSVQPGRMGEVKALCEEFIAKTKSEPNCLYYGFSFHGNEMHCREGFADASAALEHLTNVDALLKRLASLSRVSRIEVHGTAAQLELMKAPLSPLAPTYYVLEYGFRN